MDNTEQNIQLLREVLETQDVINIRFRVVDGLIQAKFKSEINQLLIPQPTVDLNLTTPEKEKPNFINSMTDSEREIEQIREEPVYVSHRFLSTDSEPERVHTDETPCKDVRERMESGLGFSPEKGSLTSIHNDVCPSPSNVVKDVNCPAPSSSVKMGNCSFIPEARKTKNYPEGAGSANSTDATCLEAVSGSSSISEPTPWRSGDKVVGWWASDSTWREAVVIQVLKVNITYTNSW